MGSNKGMHGSLQDGPGLRRGPRQPLAGQHPCRSRSSRSCTPAGPRCGRGTTCLLAVVQVVQRLEKGRHPQVVAHSHLPLQRRRTPLISMASCPKRSCERTMNMLQYKVHTETSTMTTTIEIFAACREPWQCSCNANVSGNIRRMHS